MCTACLNATFENNAQNVTMNDNFFTGHFPSRPIMPGVLIIEVSARAMILVGFGEGVPSLLSIPYTRFAELKPRTPLPSSAPRLPLDAAPPPQALAQVGGIVMLQPDVGGSKENFFFGGIDAARFRRPVVPGDTLLLRCELTKLNKRFGIAKMKARRE